MVTVLERKSAVVLLSSWRFLVSSFEGFLLQTSVLQQLSWKHPQLVMPFTPCDFFLAQTISFGADVLGQCPYGAQTYHACAAFLLLCRTSIWLGLETVLSMALAWCRSLWLECFPCLGHCSTARGLRDPTLHDCKKRDRGSLVWNAAVGPRLLETGRWCLTEVWSFEMFWDFSCCLYLFVVVPNHPTSGLSMEGIVSRNYSRCFKLLHFMLSFEQHFDRCAISALKNSKRANSSDTLMTRSTLTLLGGFMRIPGLNMHPKREPKWPKLSAELMVSNGRAACDSVRTWEQLRQIGCFW